MARNATVLIVDDDPSMRQTMELIVRSAGMRSITAMTGEQALEVCERQSVDMVLLDVQLPDTTGTQVLAQLRERHPELDRLSVGKSRLRRWKRADLDKFLSGDPRSPRRRAKAQ